MNDGNTNRTQPVIDDNKIYDFIAAYNIHTLGLTFSNDRVDVSPCVWLIVIGIVLCPPLWLGSPKDMKYVKFKNVR
jgi:hypothetical protein